jgi:general nucleoside transport system permease protein
MSAQLLIAAAIASGTPLLLAALGELVTERAGVLNLGVEGTMLIGAVSGFTATVMSGSVWIGLITASAAGMLVGVVFSGLVVTLRLNQVVTGLAFTVLGTGISSFLGKGFIGIPAPQTVPKVDFGSLSDLPIIGIALLNQNALAYFAVAMTLLISIYLRRTRPGLILKAVGESPDVLDTLGFNVPALRYAHVMAGTALIALGGAYLSLAYTPSWVDNMTAGRGWIALALVIFAGWRPWGVLFGAYLFGAIDALRFRMQIGGAPIIDQHFLNMLPYLATLLVLIVVSGSAMKRRVSAPAALGVAYDRERR